MAEDLAIQTVRLEASWAGMSNVTPVKRGMLEDAELAKGRELVEEQEQPVLVGGLHLP